MNRYLNQFQNPQRRERLLNLSDLRAPQSDKDDALSPASPIDALIDGETETPPSMQESPAHE